MTQDRDNLLRMYTYNQVYQPFCFPVEPLDISDPRPQKLIVSSHWSYSLLQGEKDSHINFDRV